MAPAASVTCAVTASACDAHGEKASDNSSANFRCSFDTNTRHATGPRHHTTNAFPGWWQWRICRISSAHFKIESESLRRLVACTEHRHERQSYSPLRCAFALAKWDLTERSQPSSASGPSSRLNWLWVNYIVSGTVQQIVTRTLQPLPLWDC